MNTPPEQRILLQRTATPLGSKGWSLNPAVTRLFAMTEHITKSPNAIANSRPDAIEVLLRTTVVIRDDRVPEHATVREKYRGHLCNQTKIYRRPDIIYFRHRLVAVTLSEQKKLDLKAGL